MSTASSLETAKTHLKAGRLADAQAVFEQIIEEDPRHAEAHHFLGTMHLDARRFDEAVRALEIAAILEPDIPRTFIDLGNACWAAERNLDAIAALQKAIDLSKTDDTKALLPMAYESLGGVLYEEKAYAEAFNCFLAVSQLAPTLTEPWVKMGIIALMREAYEQAVEVLNEALERTPDHLLALINLGNAQTALGQFEEATETYKKAIATENESREAHHALGNLYRYEGAHEDAIRAYERAASLAPGNADYQVSLALSHFDLAAWEQVEIHLSRALELDPDLPTVPFLLAAVKGERPERMPPACVEALSDGSAMLYDGLNLRRMNYGLPDILAQELASMGRTFERAVDLGCGTGLLRDAIGSYALSVTGVDVSPGMLRKAREYSQIRQEDVISFLDQVELGYDLIVAGDLAPYFGDLTELLAGAFRVLVPGGVFLVSVQATKADSWVLTKAGRYHHPAAEVAALAGGAGFEISAMREFTLRQTETNTEDGLLFVLKRASVGGD